MRSTALAAASRSLVLPLALLLAAPVALAHGPTRQKVTETIEIAAPAGKVWDAIKDYSALHTWHPAVESSETTAGNEPGSIRTLHLGGGATIVESLKKYDADAMRYSYKMEDPGPVPVTNYSSTISVAGKGDGSVVTWKGAFYRGDPNNNPPPERNDEAAIKAITGIYQSGLANLKKQVEGQ
ncbi:MAG: SRPBCC family protein [Rhodocyclaceae bacterium]|nr:SRPBCC family protein [Rhodocyclaceae bacterium]